MRRIPFSFLKRMALSIQFASGSNFTPLQIPGCVLWLDASDASTVTGTTSVTAWRDKSSRGYTSYSTAGRNPAYATNIQNGFNCIQYATGQTSIIDNFTLAQTMSIFELYYPINQSVGSPFVEQSTDANGQSGFFFHAQNNNNFLINSGAGVGIANIGTTAVSNTWQLIEGINQDPSASKTVSFYTNGTLRVSGQSLFTNNNVVKTLYINGRNNTNTLSYNAYMAEFIIYNIPLTVAQRQQVEGYLLWKWGLSSLLPATHPYKNAASGTFTIPIQMRMNNIVVPIQTVAFTGTGAVQTFTVPQGVNAFRFFMWGAGGNNQSQSGTIANSIGGGSGAYLEGTILTAPGLTYSLIVGINGGSGLLAQGGGGTSSFGGIGGGFSGIFSSTPAANTVIAIAGGGGGCGVNGGGRGGGGGYPSGSSGTGDQAGSGGTQSAGGGGGASGSQFFGGAGGSQGGGGGGGWYGGGAAVNRNNAAGGGGGSSTYISSVQLPVSINGNTGITTNGSNTPAPNESSPYWVSPVGRSAASGRIVIGYSINIPITSRSVWLPTQVPNLITWLDAALSPTTRNTLVMSGGSVSRWLDKSSSAYTYNSSGDVSLGTGGGLNLNSIFISNGPQINSSVTISLTGAQATVFLVCKPTAMGGEGFAYIIAEGNGDFALRLYNGSFPNPGNTNDWGHNPSTGLNSTFVNGTSIATSSPNILNTTAIVSSTVGRNASGITISGGFNGRRFVGFIGEILLYSTLPTTAQRQQVEGYLAWKWGLVANLPANHPYKGSPP